MTENAEIAKSISATLHPILKPLGFRKRSNSFNRTTEDGLVQLVAIQLGSYDPSGKHTIPGLIPNLHGRYRVNLGIRVPEMIRSRPPRGTWTNDYDCHLRWDLGDFMPGGLDRWWDLRDRLGLEEVSRVLVDRALPHLETLRSVESVLAAYVEEGHKAFGPIATRAVALDVADLLCARDRRSDAALLLRDYVEGVSAGSHAGHQRHVRDYLLERGFSEIASALPEN